MKRFLIALVLGAMTLHGEVDSLEGLWQGYNGEWGHVSRQLVALAEKIPAEKYEWRPGPGVRSTSEVFMHIALTNFYLLSVTGSKLPADMTSNDLEKTVTAKADVVSWLKRSLDSVKTAHAGIKPAELQHKVKIEGRRRQRGACRARGGWWGRGIWRDRQGRPCRWCWFAGDAGVELAVFRVQGEVVDRALWDAFLHGHFGSGGMGGAENEVAVFLRGGVGSIGEFFGRNVAGSVGIA